MSPIIACFGVRVLPAPPRSPAQIRFPGAAGMRQLAAARDVSSERNAATMSSQKARRLHGGFWKRSDCKGRGDRILAHVQNALISQSRSGIIKREQEFWTIPGREIQEIRTRRTTALPLKRASMIAPEEYHVAMLSIIQEAVAISPEDLGIETARRFGFDRTGPDLRQVIGLQMCALVKQGKITVDGSKVRAA
jgi:hypothetical protein